MFQPLRRRLGNSALISHSVYAADRGGCVVPPQGLCYREPGRDMRLMDARHSLLDRLRSGVPDDRVIGAIARVPRDSFVSEESRHLAYEDIALPIGLGQTISQPMIVAMMLRALDLRRSDRVLEVGTGSGYQAAVLAELVDEVVSVERIPTLANIARDRLASLGYDGVSVVVADGPIGWQAGAPYDAIVVAAAAPKLLRGLMEQLATGGRLVIPVGSLESQQLMKVVRSGDTFSVEDLGPCRFIPLIGDEAWPEPKAGGRYDDDSRC